MRLIDLANAGLPASSWERNGRSFIFAGAPGAGPPPLPTLTVTGGTITPFSRSGVDYVEVAFTASGSFTLSAGIAWHNRALGAGGGTGGRSASATYVPGGGGAGGLLRTLAAALASGAYTVTIGAGGAAISSGITRNNGSNSALYLPGGGTETAIGGGAGGLYNTGMTSGADGGSGGGGRGPNTTGIGAGLGTSGQGNAGGLGFGSTDEALRASGGGGGAGGAGGAGASGVAGSAGAGVLLDWIASPATVCAGGAGMLVANTDASPGASLGSGSRGAINADVGKGGDGFLFLVVRADQVNVVTA